MNKKGFSFAVLSLLIVLFSLCGVVYADGDWKIATEIGRAHV